MRKLRGLPKQLMSKKILSLILDDFSFFGSVPFYLFVTLSAYFIGNTELFLRLSYGFLIAFIVLLAVKTVHYKERPQKEEFNIFMERMVASSFPSSHSLGVTGLSIFLALAYPFPWLITMLSFVSVMVYLQRYVTKKHFWIDIIGGILIAIAICVFVVKVF
jgi:membrane-associated phospholipid phosphatase